MAVIVQYHAIGDATTGAHGYAKPSICLPADVFDRQIAFLAAHYRCVTMDDLAAALDGGPALPLNAAVITFDDGYRDNYDLAFPILQRHRVPATFYVTTDCLDGGTPLWPSELRCLVHRSRHSRLPNPFGDGDHDVSTPERRDQAIEDIKARLVRLSRRDREAALDVLRAKEDTSFLRGTMLTWAQVREMAGKGMTFGSHTVSHPLLPSIPHEEAVAEIRDSKTVLEGQLGRPVRHFSYPNPGKGVHTDDVIRRVVAESGYATAVTTRRGYVSRTANALDLSRMAVGQSTRDFIWNIESPALLGALSPFKTRGPR
jgi:peptidoglycan/xylan/chitin deacetylase (PgdA/CDA1 family)